MLRCKLQGVFDGKGRILALALAVSVAVTSLFCLHGVQAKPTEADDIKVYYPLKGAVDGNGNTDDKSSFVDDFHKTSDWLFQGKDFSGNVKVFSEPDVAFERPEVVPSDDGRSAQIKWSAVGGADNYGAMVISGNRILTGGAIKTDKTELKINDLSINREYYVQITAYSGNTAIKSSVIGSFITYNSKENEKVLIKGDSKTETSNFTGVKTLADGSSALYFTDKNSGYRSFVLGAGNTLDFGSNTKALAFKFSQAATDGNKNKWLSVAFKPTIDTTDNASWSGNNVTMYYVTDDKKVYETKNNGNTRFSSISFPEISGGWVIIPASLFKSGYFTDSATHRFVLTVEQMYEINYNSAKNEYTKSANQVRFDGHELYISDFCEISDIDWFIKSLTYSGSEYTQNGEFVYDCDTQDTNKATLTNSASQSGYCYGYSENEKARATLSYTLKNSGGHRYGMSLGFEVKESGIYDLSNYIKVENSKREADIYYRVIKESAEGFISRISPDNTDWAVLKADTKNNFSPESALQCIQAELFEGETLRLEAYAEFADNSDGEVNIRLGNTALTKVTVKQAQDSGVASVTEYRAAAYTDCFRNETFVNEGYYLSGDNRFNVSAVKTDGSSEAEELTKYIPFENNFTRLGNKNIGLLTDISGAVASVKTRTSSQYGIRFDFNSPKSGEAEISFFNEGNKNSRFRLLINGKQLYPESGWSSDEGAVLKKTEIFKGDILSVEQYSDNTAETDASLGDLKVVLNESANTSNISGSGYYSALWVRPFDGRVYNGEFNQAESVWNFDLIDKNKSISQGDSFSSQVGRIVYNSSMGTDIGYIFEQNRIVFKTDTASSGAALSFKATETGYYDFSYLINILSGRGAVEYRLRKNDIGIYPESGYDILPAGESVISQNGEIYLRKDEKLFLEIYISKLEEPMMISLGAPMVIKGVEVTPNADGNIASYKAAKFIRQEGGFNGALGSDAKRFEYEIISGGILKQLDISDFRNRIIKNAEIGSGYKIINGELSIAALSSNTAKISFSVPRSGKATVLAKPASSGNFTLKITKKNASGNSVIFEGSGSNSYNVNEECDLEFGDVVIFELSGADEINLSNSLAVDISGVYSTANSPDSNIFIASLDYPYGEDSYVGEYNERGDIWRFNILKYENDEYTVGSVDYYNSTDSNRLYNKQTDAGYYFKDSMLTAELTENTGISLDFIAPCDNIFELSSALRLLTDYKDIKVRILKNGKKLGDIGDWKTVENASIYEDIEIPMQYLELKENDTVSIQVYCSNALSGERVRISLGSPTVRIHSPERLANSDFSADIYTPYIYSPLAHLGFDSGTNVKDYAVAQNLWNYEFIDLLEQGAVNSANPKEVIANHYTQYKQSSIVSYKNEANNPNYEVQSDKLLLRMFTSLYKNSSDRRETAGESLRFVSPQDNDVILFGAPYANKDFLSGQRVYFRILLNDETVYPESGWEVLEGDKKTSEFSSLKLSLKKGDELRYQFYTDAADDVLLGYDNKSCNQVMIFSPQIAVMRSLSKQKSIFNFVNDMSKINMQLSPFWKIRYAEDINNPVWLDMERYHTGWNYWLSTAENYMGISPTGAGEFWISNDSFETNYHPEIAAEYTAHETGYLIFDNVTVKVMYKDRFPAGMFRITQNGKQIFPEGDKWQTVDDESIASIENTSIAIDKDDKIRFEFSSKQPLQKGEQIKVLLNPRFIYSKYDAVYSTDKDIFGMLDKEMYQYFKGLEASRFDQNPDKSLKGAEDFLNAQAKLKENWLAKLFGILSPEENKDQTIIEGTAGTPGYYIEGTPETIIKRKKKIITTITGGIPDYVIVIIAVVSVLVLAAGIVAVIIILKKRKRKVTQK